MKVDPLSKIIDLGALNLVTTFSRITYPSSSVLIVLLHGVRTTIFKCLSTITNIESYTTRPYNDGSNPTIKSREISFYGPFSRSNGSSILYGLYLGAFIL